jgi:hypothetical protein
MKIRYLFPVLLAACSPVFGQDQIVSEEIFRDNVVGVPLRLGPDVVFTINADNTLVGDIDGQTATGTWDFVDGYWCRTITLDTVFTEDCQLWAIDGDELVITRDRGNGETFRYRVAE